MTRNPNALWVSVQLHEAWEYGDQPHRFLIFDRDAKFSADVVSTVKAMGSQSIRTAFRSPWQNGIAERWVGSVRRDLPDHVIVLDQKHLRQLLNEYIRYYHEDRTHLGLGKDTPGGRVAASAPSSGHKVISLPRLGSPLVSGTLRAVEGHACKALGFKKERLLDRKPARLVLMNHSCPEAPDPGALLVEPI